MALPTHHHYHHVFIGKRAAGVSVHSYRSVEFLDEVVGPKRLAGLFVEAVKLPCRPSGEDQIACDKRRGVGPWSVRHVIFFRERGIVTIFPEGLPRHSVESYRQFLPTFAIHGEQLSSLNCDARETFTQLTAPQFSWATWRPRCCQPGD